MWNATNSVLGVEEKIQAGLLFESLRGYQRQIVLSELNVAEIIADDGVKNIVDTLDKFFLPNKVQSAYDALNDLFSYKCDDSISTESFIMEFQLKISKIKASGTILPDYLLGYMLLKCANLSEVKFDLVKATCQDLSYQSVKAQLIKVRVGKSNVSSLKESDTSRVQIESFYSSKFSKSSTNLHKHRAKKRSCSKTNSTKQRNLKSNHPKTNAVQRDGTVYNKFGITLYIDSNSEQLCSLIGDTLGQAVIDTGSPYTVAGELWFKGYVSSLSRRDRSSICYQKSQNRICFGDGGSYRSKYHVMIPIYIQQHKFYVGVDVISCNIPLLLSRSTLCEANAKIDVGTSSIELFGKISPLVISCSGHLCLSICRSLDTACDESNRLLSSVLFRYPVFDNKTKAKKLHEQFCHPQYNQLIVFVREAIGKRDEDLENAIKEVTSQCGICIKIKQESSRYPKQVHHTDNLCDNQTFYLGNQKRYCRNDKYNHRCLPFTSSCDLHLVRKDEQFKDGAETDSEYLTADESCSISPDTSIHKVTSGGFDKWIQDASTTCFNNNSLYGNHDLYQLQECKRPLRRSVYNT